MYVGETKGLGRPVPISWALTIRPLAAYPTLERNRDTLMRQVVKDRLARIDERIRELQELYNNTSKESFKKNYLYEIQRLCDKKDEIANHAIFGSLNMSKYQHGLQERQMNLEGAIEEQKAIADDILLCMEDPSPDLARLKRLRAKIGNCNRIIAIYRKSLESWIRRGANTAIVKPERARLTLKEDRAVYDVENKEPDAEIVGYLNNPRASTKAANSTSIEMITRPEHKQDLRIKTIEELRLETPGLGMYQIKVTPTPSE
jgi:hypothetical protein